MNKVIFGEMKNPSSQLNAALTQRLQNGDKEAFEELYDQYNAALYGIICKIVRSEEVSQDVLQDAFVKIWKHIHTYNPTKGSLFTWMLNIARNTAIDQLRKLKKENKVDIQTLDFNVDMVNTTAPGKNENTIGVTALVQKLPEEQKRLLEYIYFSGYTQKEVSEKLDIPLGTVKSRVRSAIKTLRKAFNTFLFWI
ncbi:MAG: RNA polymerase sigma factor [Chitinophagaceae bacterium]|nr:RNA polymerase sigma factor [Chitinophagaceae bacterium]